MGGDRANPCNDDADTLTRQLNNQDLRPLSLPRPPVGGYVPKRAMPLPNFTALYDKHG